MPRKLNTQVNMQEVAMRKIKHPAALPKKVMWSKRVTEESNALDLEKGVFTRTPRQIALSLKRSAERSDRRKSSPFRSAMSMLTFYQNRAGTNLSKSQIKTLDAAKDELRKLYGREVLHSPRKKTKKS
jgi:hypothetical protein